MDRKLELVAVPVSDIDRAKAFYVDQVGFLANHDHQVSEEVRFVQLLAARLGMLNRHRHWDRRRAVAGVAARAAAGRRRRRRGA